MSDHPTLPSVDDVARVTAWETFGEVAKASAASSSDKLRRYAEACMAAGRAHTSVARFGRTEATADD